MTKKEKWIKKWLPKTHPKELLSDLTELIESECNEAVEEVKGVCEWSIITGYSYTFRTCSENARLIDNSEYCSFCGKVVKIKEAKDG